MTTYSVPYCLQLVYKMSTSNGVIPNGHSKRDDNHSKRDDTFVFRMSGFMVVLSTFPLPAIGFVMCIILSLIMDFKESTSTTCSVPEAGRVPNFLPSISSSIGNFTPQRYIWRIAFALHLAPRFMFALMHYNYNMSFPVTSNRAWYRRLNGFACFVHYVEIIGLILLTYISSSENYPIHEKGFMLFLGASELYMLIVIILFTWARQDLTWTSRDIQSFRLKIIFFAVNFISACMALYFFNRHMAFCEPNMYSWFAFFEYLIVLSNAGYHCTWLLMECAGSKLQVTVPVRPGQYTNLPV